MRSSRRRRRSAFPANDDFNGASQEGAGYYQTTTRNGRRGSTARTYLRAARERHNLKIETNALAQRMLFDGKRASGVAYRQNGALKSAKARKEVLVSSGAYNSPQLLQLSGVGPGELLRQHGIDVVLDAPGVGGSLQDHLQVRIVSRCSQKLTINDDVMSLRRKAMMAMRYAFLRKGPLSIAAASAGAFFKTHSRLETPDMQVHFIPFSTDKMGEKLHEFSGFTAHVCQLRPESRGSVKIKSADPSVAPEIRINYLATETDRTTNIEGLKILRKILAAPAMKPFIAAEEEPGPQVTSDDGPAGLRAPALQHGVSSDLDLPHGQRSAGRGRPAPAREGHRGPARDRCLDHAGPRLGQHQRAGGRDRREGERHDFGGCEVVHRAPLARAKRPTSHAVPSIWPRATGVAQRPLPPAKPQTGRNDKKGRHAMNRGLND